MEKSEILVGETFLDFGAGFYTTTSYDQAERWARIKMRRENKDKGYVAIYEFDFDAAKKNGYTGDSVIEVYRWAFGEPQELFSSHKRLCEKIF